MNTTDLQQRLRDFLETYRGVDALGFTGLMHQAAEALERLERVAEAQRHEVAHARARIDNAVALLTGIHSLMYPAPITSHDGRTMVFRPKDPDPHEVLQELSDRIRALPEQLAGLQDADAARDAARYRALRLTVTASSARRPFWEFSLTSHGGQVGLTPEGLDREVDELRASIEATAKS